MSKRKINSESIFNLIDYPKPFKNQNYAPNRRVKPFKQLLANEKSWIQGLPKNKNDKKVQLEKMDYKKPSVVYWELEPPPSLLPNKKYCDITGLEAPYVDPKTNLRYHSSEVYQVIRHLPVEVPQDYLMVRKAAVILK